jgi:hypothetical protein
MRRRALSRECTRINAHKKNGRRQDRLPHKQQEQKWVDLVACLIIIHVHSELSSGWFLMQNARGELL